METKERVEGLTEIFKARLDKYKQTRDLQFKVNIALWTLIVLVGNKGDQTLMLSGWNDYLFYGLIVVVVVMCHYFFWLTPMSASMARDNVRALSLQKQVENMINETSDKPERDEAEIKRCYHKMNLFLAGITLLLLLLLGIFLVM